MTNRYYLYYSDDDEPLMTDDEMAFRSVALLIGASQMPETPLREKLVSCLGKITKRLLGPVCEECRAAEPDHYYTCSKAQKCKSCQARTDIPNVQHYAHCRRNEPKQEAYNPRRYIKKKQVTTTPPAPAPVVQKPVPNFADDDQFPPLGTTRAQ